MEVDFTGRTIVVTGAGGGLGRQYALDIAARGGNVVVNDLGGNVDGDNGSSSMADAVVQEIQAAGGKAVANYDSVASSDGAAAIADAALSAFGRIDGLINNAGNLRNFWFEEFSDADRDSVIGIHLIGTWNVTKAVWPHMKKDGYGRILFVSSGAGMFGNQTQSAYGAAKGGVVGLMNVLTQEGAKHGILCNALLPNAASRMGEKMKPEELAPMAAYTPKYRSAMLPEFVGPLGVYLASEACITGHDMYSVLGGRIARAFVGVTEGWLGPRDAPPSVEDIAAHIDEIRDETRGIHIPSCLIDEFRIVAEQVDAQKG
ncbi:MULTISPECIES: SDR family NAD(P)-dependent oxidoreductase [unclassified Sphingobium]|uniref:SDR family NAD(P)-dependent oxidoreductase n=1 Tax=unclassified Sphingobium TaxID=2611147 RepID=UPI000D16665A|nr:MULTISPECIES: SDR family NAD(P)-dependent oxidoreductase [unclassified Sphingobium]MBG6120124.1 NAD(P)-dependent dehydrogenase (short-subunit alcohol dehydrogenase family) [Sphingobium sp. JAI105]PSO12833.1 short-chain dehydrogenase [Sphingobium sp. AEW4]TWD05675.1 NAD(P)-dependent dehydrogenase (short-subunit alcohol dehydrogenase family) [Sphingobium sp. AEW010]TWD23228.1 NAD(P)-dependent dehydrogenase (short-subunit alcohol dehydrogenase family) [Sphingobium sp. AEW013]TWD25088.1 NAD(P)-